MNMYSIYAHTNTLHPYIVPLNSAWNDNLHIIKCYTTPQWALFWKKKIGTGSGITLLCGFTVAQARVTRQKWQQEDQYCQFGDLVVGPDHYPDTIGELNCLIFGRTVHVCNKQCGLLGALPSFKALWWSVSLLGSKWIVCVQAPQNFVF